MLVKDIVNFAVKAELRTLSIADIGTEDIRDSFQLDNLESIVSFVNQGVIELNKRFPLLLKDLDITSGYYTLEDDLNITPHFLDALVNYIAYKGHTTVKPLTEGSYNPYWIKFEESCLKLKEVKDSDYVTATPEEVDTLYNKFNDRGFV